MAEHEVTDTMKQAQVVVSQMRPDLLGAIVKDSRALLVAYDALVAVDEATMVDPEASLLAFWEAMRPMVRHVVETLTELQRACDMIKLMSAVEVKDTDGKATSLIDILRGANPDADLQPAGELPDGPALGGGAPAPRAERAGGAQDAGGPDVAG